jgi:hypothetical protein
VAQGVGNANPYFVYQAGKMRGFSCRRGRYMTLVERAQAIITKPKEAWPQLAAEPQTVGSLYTGYIIPLAAIGPICTLIGSMLLFHRSIMFGVISAVLTYVLVLVGVYVTAMIAQLLAPSFNGNKDQVQALKWCAYSQTPGWVAGVFNLVPVVGPLLVLLGALYGLYLLFLGVSPTMGVPAETAAGYAIVVIICAIVVSFFVAFLAGIILVPLLVMTGASMY